MMFKLGMCAEDEMDSQRLYAGDLSKGRFVSLVKLRTQEEINSLILLAVEMAWVGAASGPQGEKGVDILGERVARFLIRWAE